MDTSLWSVEGSNKARLNAPLALTDQQVVAASERLATFNEGRPRQLLGAFRSTPMQPHAGIPIFGLVLVIGIAIVVLAIWLAVFDRNGIIARGLSVRVIVVGTVLLVIGVALLLYSGRKLYQLVRDLRQLFLIFDNGVAHILPDATNVYSWSQIKEVRHQSVSFEYGGMSTGTEHAYTVIDRDGRQLVLLGRSYGTANDEASGDTLTDVEQVGRFLEAKVN